MKNFIKHDFEQRTSLSSESKWSLLLSTLRSISEALKLSVIFHILRQIIHFGSWRIFPIALIRKLRPPLASSDENKQSLLGIIDEKEIAEELRQNSVSVIGLLPPEFVARLRQITDRLPYEEYQLVHQINNEVRLLTQDPGIMKVLRAYLKCEPVLLEASLFVSKSEKSLPQDGQNSFHFDYAGWESLNVFVYLTDVTENSSYHEVAQGSHRDVRFRDIVRGSLSIEEGKQRFGRAIQPITGPAGTLFFENTEAFHRRNRGNERRVMLNLLFASHQSLLSHGRASPEQLEIRNQAFKSLGVL